MGTKERRERQRRMLRQEILNAARELFAKEGYDNVSMRKIAEKIDYSPTTIYLHFKDKAELLRCICDETFENLLEIMRSLKNSCDDPVVCLRKALRAYIEFGLSHPNHYKVAFIVHPGYLEDLDHYTRESSKGRQAFEELMSKVVECIQQGRFLKLDAKMVSQGLWAGIHGITSLLIVHRDYPWVDRNDLIDHVVDTMLRGLEAEPERFD
ncbi:MAG: TetR/AcrR family transcriptional regulator [Acidobacteriota bacterium]|nr:TetR/AcrR family transcriptional regulator [Blastocatellia bacterium]MDW8412404.1 TetR/AcrR family transcriptional regulator [Acidobacteriota bacterium]